MRTTMAICVILLLAGAAPASAQAARQTSWVILGGGASLAGGDDETSSGVGLAGHVGLAHQRGPFLVSFRAGMNGGGTTGEHVGGGGTLRDRFDEVALLAGYAVHRAEGSQVVLSTGIAAVSGERVGAIDLGRGNVPFDTRIGLPLQLDIWNPAAATSFGISLHANFNAEEVFGALTVTYLIGLASGR